MKGAGIDRRNSVAHFQGKTFFERLDRGKKIQEASPLESVCVEMVCPKCLHISSVGLYIFIFSKKFDLNLYLIKLVIIFFFFVLKYVFIALWTLKIDNTVLIRVS